MKRIFAVLSALVLTLAIALPAMAANEARVRVVHASPDAPAVDVLVNGAKAFTNAPFKGITAYAPLAAGSYKVQVVPTGATTPVVIDATLALEANTDYTVVAMGKLANIGPIVLKDNNAAPAAGKAHVRIVHASPDAPAVDIAVKGGPVLFSNLAFKAATAYAPVDAGTYDLEVRAAGTTTVALPLAGIKLEAGKIYTFFAMGLLTGQPALTVVPLVDSPLAAAALPKTGEPVTNNTSILAILMVGIASLATGLYLRKALIPTSK